MFVMNLREFVLDLFKPRSVSVFPFDKELDQDHTVKDHTIKDQDQDDDQDLLGIKDSKNITGLSKFDLWVLTILCGIIAWLIYKRTVILLRQ